MRSTNLRIFTVLLVALMLFFSIGVPVYKHSCACSSKTIASVFVEVTCADSHGKTCCADTAAPTQSCCIPVTKNNCEHESSCDVSGCCKTETHVYQIESEYQLSQEKFYEVSLISEIIIAFIDFGFVEESTLFSDNFYTDTSPPREGRQFLTAVHQLKFDIPVC